MGKVTAKKYGGNDAYSWAVFLDGRPVVTGLSQREVKYHKQLVQEVADKRTTATTSDKRS